MSILCPASALFIPSFFPLCEAHYKQLMICNAMFVTPGLQRPWVWEQKRKNSRE